MRRSLLACLAGGLTLMALNVTAAGSRRVLLVHSFGRDFAPFNVVAEQFRTDLARESSEPVEFMDVSLEMARFDAVEKDAPLLQFLSAVYESRHPDLLVPVGAPALQFCERHRASLFQRTPILALGVDQRRLAGLAPDERMTCAAFDLDLPRLVEHILRVLPETRHIYVVMGRAPLERFWEGEFRREWASFEKQVTFHWLSDQPLQAMREQLTDLPAHSAIFCGIVNEDAAGVTYEGEQALVALLAVADAPILGYSRTQLGLGIVGGPLLSLRALGRQGAKAALRLLKGEPPAAIRVEPQRLGPPIYDGRELERWGIDENRLPPGSTILFHVPSLWEKHRWKIAGVLALCVIEAGLIVALLAQLRQRRRAEGALRESEQRMQLAVEAAAVGLWSWDAQQNRIWASEQARRLYGMTPGEPISFQTFLGRVHPEDRQRVEKAVRQVLQGDRLREYYRVIHPDGGLRWLLAIGSLTTTSNRKSERLMGVSLDVTDRKTADEALQRAQALTEAVFDSVPGMLYLYTAEGQLIRWNKKHEELTGYSHDELARFKAADWFEDEDLTVMTRAWERVFTVGQASAELNLTVKGGTKIPCLLTGVRVDIDGKAHLVGIGIDLSERRQAEAKLAQVTAHLAHATRVGVLGELTSALAHELNQPLAAILSNAQAARRFLAGDEPDLGELRAILDDIVSDDKRAGEIIHRLRAMLRKEPVPRSRCDLNDIVREVLSTLNSELIAQNVLVRTELEPALPPVEVVRVEIQQVLINLLMNAAQAMKDTPPGQRTVTVQTSHCERNILVTIRDRGHGIPEEKLSHVFDPFFTTKASGLGMGLAICRRLIEAHGGWIKAENNPVGGAQFTCSLPMHVAKKQPQNG